MQQEADWDPFVPISLRVAARKDLPANAKLLHAIIGGLAHKHGYCWATNAYLGGRLGIESRYVSRLLGLLEEKGLLRCVVQQNRGNVRHLYVLPEPVEDEAGNRAIASHPHVQTDTTPQVCLDRPSRTDEREGDGHLCVPPHVQMAHQVYNSENIKESKKESGEESPFDSSRVRIRDVASAVDCPASLSRAGQTVALRRSERRYQKLWEALLEPQRRRFRAEVRARLGSEALTETEIEARACRLFAASEAKAWIERRRQSMRAGNGPGAGRSSPECAAHPDSDQDVAGLGNGTLPGQPQKAAETEQSVLYTKEAGDSLKVSIGSVACEDGRDGQV